MSGMNGLVVAMEQAQHRRDAAAVALAQTRQHWLAAQVQLDQLESYAQECTARWLTRQLNCTPDLMRNHYQFMERLEHAIGLQSGVVSDHDRHIERATGVLRDAEQRLESLRQLVAARKADQRRLSDRRDQKQSDEQAALSHRRRMDEMAGGLR